MCLAIPGKLLSVEMQYNDMVRMGKIDFGGVQKEATLELLPDVQIGDYVLVHVGVAISKVDEAEAQRVFSYLREAGELDELTESQQDAIPPSF